MASPGVPDLRLIVTRETLADGRKALRFQLQTWSEGTQPFHSQPFQVDPEEHFAEMFQNLEENLPNRRLGWLSGRGAQLSEELLPEPLRQRLVQLRGSARTLEILSDEVWIPWELLRLQDPVDPASDFFLVEAFNLTRWLQGISPVFKFPLRRIALVVPRDSGLPSTQVEREWMAALGDLAREVIEIPARHEDVSNALAAGQYDGFHFAGHGRLWGVGRPRWSILLERGEQLDPEDLRGPARQLGRAQPLVFLNACHSGHGAASLTGLAGLAGAFLKAGAGAFIGSHWDLADSQTLSFAQDLYTHLLEGMEIGEAVRKSRLALRDRFPESHGWLAYAVFAHPLARCTVPPTPRPWSPNETAPRPARERIHEKDGTVLVHVPGGERTPPFWMGKFLVTNEQYARFLEENPDAREPAFWSDPRFNRPRHPVVGVSWDEAQAYCRWAGLELPTEEQWEAAARGDDQRLYPWGAGQPTPLHANFGGQEGGTTPVDAHPAGRGPYGTFDQAGNVWEWCADAWPPAAAPQGETIRVLRGGSWKNPPQDLQATWRDRAPARQRLNNLGFRCVWRPS